MSVFEFYRDIWNELNWLGESNIVSNIALRFSIIFVYVFMF